jgi:hypothetical protein
MTLLKKTGLIRNTQASGNYFRFGLVKNKGLIKTESTIPTADVFLWTGKYDGNDLVNSKGANGIYVSGTPFSLDAVYDFSGLNDERFNKLNATYWGSSIDPYFYLNPARPYDSKLPDFHYKFLNEQVTFDDTFYLKATATSDTSNVINGVQELHVFSTVQTGDNKSNLKTYIGLQPDHLGPEEVSNWDFSSSSNWNLGSGYTISGGFLVASGTGDQCTNITSFVLNELYLTEMKLVDVTQGVIRPELGTTNGTNRDADGVYQEVLTAVGVQRVSLDAGLTFIGKVEYFSVKRSFIDYYSS